jgi:hypothetical protein
MPTSQSNAMYNGRFLHLLLVIHRNYPSPVSTPANLSLSTSLLTANDDDFVEFNEPAPNATEFDFDFTPGKNGVIQSLPSPDPTFIY